MSSPRRSSVTRGAIWSAVDRCGVVLLQFIINLVLARMLSPDDFGLVGMILIFVAVSQTLIDGGFAAALIQKRDASARDYSTIFYWNILFSVALYGVIYIAASAVAGFFAIPALRGLLRVLGVVIIINSFAIVQRTVLRKELNFKTIAIVDILSYGIAAAVAAFMASRGYGVWSLVGMHLTIGLLSALLFWLMSRWRPTMEFSFSSFRGLFSYGGYLLVASMMQDICTHIQGVVIGRRFSAAETGLYAQAKKMDEVASLTLPALLCQVLFPVYSSLQDDLSTLRRMLAENVRMVAFLIFPLMTLLMIVAKPLFLFLYGSQWVEAVPYFQILCVGGLFSALYNFSYYAVAAVGRSRELFLWGCYKWGMLIALLLGGAMISMRAVLWAMVISNLNIYLTNALLAQRYVGYSLVCQLRDVAPTLLLSAIVGSAVYSLNILISLHWLLCCMVFVLLYVALSWVCGLRALDDIWHFIISYQKRKKDDRGTVAAESSGAF